MLAWAHEPDCLIDVPMYVCRYPNGWFRVIDSDELKPGDVKQVTVAGRVLAVYRGLNNEQVYVLDAYCPHLGANLAVGGKVKGDCIECPFHQWQFNGTFSPPDNCIPISNVSFLLLELSLAM